MAQYILAWSEILCCSEAGGISEGWTKAVDDFLFTVTVSCLHDYILYLADGLCDAWCRSSCHFQREVIFTRFLLSNLWAYFCHVVKRSLLPVLPILLRSVSNEALSASARIEVKWSFPEEKGIYVLACF